MSEPIATPEQPDRETRAREWIRALTTIVDRYAGTTAERTAAERVGAWMQDLGIRDVAFISSPSAPRAGYVLALHAGLGVVACWWGGLVGLILAACAAYSFRSEFRARRPLLSRLFAPNDSVNVIGRYGPDAPARRVILSAHIDTAQAGLLFAPALADAFAGLSGALRRDNAPPAGPHALPENLLLGGVLVVGAAWLGAHGILLGIAQAVLVAGLIIACALGLQWATAPATPGANDNASAVAAMLTCAERLMADLPRDVELWLVGTGAEEVGCAGMRAFVAQHTDWPPDTTYYVNFECVGGGRLHYIRSEGVLGKVSYTPTLNELARRVVAAGEFGDVTPTDLLAGTDGHVPAAYGYPALSLISLEANGVPRNYHRLSDTVEALDMGMVVRAADFGGAVTFAALRGAAGPVGK